MHQKPSDVRPGADAWALDAERQSDQGRAINAAIITDFNSFDQLIDLHLKDMREVGKPLARSKDYALRTLRKHLGKIKIAYLTRECFVDFGSKPIQTRPEAHQRKGYNERFNETLRHEVLNAE